ncbi:MAG: signal peptidase I [Patescibacteria group bacterium]
MEEKKEESFFKEIFRFAIITLVVVLPIRFFIAEPFIVSGASMEPTFEDTDYLIVDRITYSLENPERNDVIIFRYPKNPEKYFIKRIIGLPEETVTISGNNITIRNKNNPEGFNLDQTYITFKSEGKFQVTLKKDEYFVMGDNRSHSSDSRIWGAVPRENIIGRAFLRLFPPKSIDIFPGKINSEERV